MRVPPRAVGGRHRGLARSTEARRPHHNHTTSPRAASHEVSCCWHQQHQQAAEMCEGRTGFAGEQTLRQCEQHVSGLAVGCGC
jgi:hypothetical protein